MPRAFRAVFLWRLSKNCAMILMIEPAGGSTGEMVARWSRTVVVDRGGTVPEVPLDATEFLVGRPSEAEIMLSMSAVALAKAAATRASTSPRKFV